MTHSHSLLSQRYRHFIFSTFFVLGMWYWFSLCTNVSLTGTLPDILFLPCAVLFLLICKPNIATVSSPYWRWVYRLACAPLVVGSIVFGLTVLLVSINPLSVLFLASEIGNEETIAQVISPNGLLVVEAHFRSVGAYTGGDGRVFIRAHARSFPVIEQDLLYETSDYGHDVELVWKDSRTVIYRHGDSSGHTVEEPLVIGNLQFEVPYLFAYLRSLT